MSSYSTTPDDDLFILDELYELVVCNRPVELETYLRRTSYARLALTVVGQRNEERISLLIVAARYGFDHVVRILLDYNCTKQQVELEGCIFSIKGNFVENATALWCALDRDHYEVARTLIEVGRADVNHGPSQPLLIDAVIRHRYRTVEFLVENDYADINQTVANGMERGTSLVAAACAADKSTIIYLLSKGAKLDYQTHIFQNTALSYAAERGFLDIVQLLCWKGASRTIKNSVEKTPLMLAAENQRLEVVEFLLQFDHDESTLNDLELLAARYMIANDATRHSRPGLDIQLLRQSFQGRMTFNIPKKVAQPIAAYDFQQECQTMDELDRIMDDPDRLHNEALLITERVVLPQNDKALFIPLLQHLSKLNENEQFDRCFHLCLHIFHLHQQMDLPIELGILIMVFCRMLTADVFIPIDQFLTTCRLIFAGSQQKPNDNCIRNALHLVTIATKILKQPSVSNGDRRSIIQCVQNLCRQHCTTSDGETLLHLSVDSQTQEKINYTSSDVRSVLVYPNIDVVRLLINYGNRWIDLNAVEQVRGDTALHIISRSWNLPDNVNSTPIVEMLINAGAHIDCVNKYGRTPLDETVEIETHILLQSKQRPLRLKCLCAHMIADQKLSYAHLWPAQTTLNTFVLLHGGLRKEHSYPNEYNSTWNTFEYESDDYDDAYLSD